VKRIHLLRVEEEPERFATLVAAARAAGLRLGWLEGTPPAPLPDALAAAARAGVLRAVGVGEGMSAAVKPLVGPPVLADLLREHFRGCAAVLVRGALAPTDAPLLAPAGPSAGGELPGTISTGDRWRVTLTGGARTTTTAELLARLRRPRPWGDDSPGDDAGEGGSEKGSGPAAREGRSD
jgi:hypothetical protein